MCGLVGIVMKEKGLPFPVDTFYALMAEARIRGQHATGVSYFNKQGDEYFVDTFKKPVPANEFPYPSLYETEAAIGHCRYSTSDLEYNQPIGFDQYALVHNGVVTQEPYEKWEKLFGVKCIGKNDAEILARLQRDAGRHPLSLVNTSQACIMIEHLGDDRLVCRWWRNEQRPLYYVEFDKCIVIASTKDIIFRAIAPMLEFAPIKECEPCYEYVFSVDDFGVHQFKVREPLEDLQNV